MSFLTQLLLCVCLLPFSAAFLDFSACTFPFVYKNKTYPTCTKDGSRFNRLWCATTSNYDKDHEWKRCYEKEHGGNSNGKPCVFPFVYLKRKFYTCTDEKVRPRMFWCATTSNYDINKTWSYCPDTILAVKPTSEEDQKRTSCDSSGKDKNPHNLRVSSSLEEADRLKLTDVQQTRFGDYEQGGDQDMII